MKTSLNIDDRVFADAKKEALRTGRSLSEVVSLWASLGRNVEKQRCRKAVKKFKPFDLGPEQIDLSSRTEWMEFLDE